MNPILVQLYQEKKFEFFTINTILQRKDKKDVIFINFIQNNSIYLLW